MFSFRKSRFPAGEYVSHPTPNSLVRNLTELADMMAANETYMERCTMQGNEYEPGVGMQGDATNVSIRFARAVASGLESSRKLAQTAMQRRVRNVYFLFGSEVTAENYLGWHTDIILDNSNGSDAYRIKRINSPRGVFVARAAGTQVMTKEVVIPGRILEQVPVAIEPQVYERFRSGKELDDYIAGAVFSSTAPLVDANGSLIICPDQYINPSGIYTLPEDTVNTLSVDMLHRINPDSVGNDKKVLAIFS